MRPKSMLLISAAVALGLCVATFPARPAAQSAPAKGKTETYYYFVFTNAQEGQEEEYNKYYDYQHAPDVVSIPGFMTAQRYIVADTQLRNTPPPSKYLIVYKVVTDDLAAVQAEVSRRIKSGETVINPVMVGARNSPGGYFKVISPMIMHKGQQAPLGKGKAETYYQFVFSNPKPGTSDADFNNWYTNTHGVEVVSSPRWIEAQRGQLTNPRERPGQTTYNYMIMFKIVTDDLAATFDAYRVNSKAHPMTSGPLGENVGFTYKEFGPLHLGDQVRAERAAKKAKGQ